MWNQLAQKPTTLEEDKFIRILAVGSGIAPTSVNTVLDHLSTKDTLCWKLILEQFTKGTREDVQRILSKSLSVKWVSWDMRQLVDGLLQLPGIDSIREKIVIL